MLQAFVLTLKMLARVDPIEYPSLLLSLWLTFPLIDLTPLLTAHQVRGQVGGATQPIYCATWFTVIYFRPQSIVHYQIDAPSCEAPRSEAFV